jgi:DNA-binding GntR family transcriptional regulator
MSTILGGQLELGLKEGSVEGVGDTIADASSDSVGTIGPLRRRTSLVDEVAERIRELVFSGHLASGTRLSDSRLAEELGIGRGSIREAFKALLAEGFLEHTGKEVRVAQLSREDVIDIFEVRLAIECRAARIVAKRHDDEDIESLRSIVRRFTASVAEDDIAEAVDLDLRFHQCLCRLSGSPRLLELFTREVVKMFALLSIDVDTYRPLGVWADDLPTILAAIQRGDADAASAAIEKHIDITREDALPFCTPSPRA